MHSKAESLQKKIENFCTNLCKILIITCSKSFFNLLVLSSYFRYFDVKKYVSNVRFVSYSKCSNWRQISEISSNFGCLLLFVVLLGQIKSKLNYRLLTTNPKGQMPPRRLCTLTRGIQIRGQPIKYYKKKK